MPTPTQRRRRRAAVLVLCLAVLGVGVTWFLSRSPAPAPGCFVTVGTTTDVLDFEQAQHATTIAAVGKQLGLPNHAVTVALAAALQESKLHNLDHGDRDSLGLFQQRPSQGWGTPEQLQDPRYAATAFYQRLVKVPGWSGKSVTEAAQAVQRSAAPDAYGRWEPEARRLASGLTGEVPAALACAYSAAGDPDPAAVSRDAAAELGPEVLGSEPESEAQGWMVASWLVGHGNGRHLSSVSYAGRRWTASSGRWKPDTSAGATPTFA